MKEFLIKKKQPEKKQVLRPPVLTCVEKVCLLIYFFEYLNLAPWNLMLLCFCLFDSGIFSSN